jgi:hypothetical protein
MANIAARRRIVDFLFPTRGSNTGLLACAPKTAERLHATADSFERNVCFGQGFIENSTR